jgi:hypothetical protein
MNPCPWDADAHNAYVSGVSRQATSPNVPRAENTKNIQMSIENISENNPNQVSIKNVWGVYRPSPFDNSTNTKPNVPNIAT